MQRKLWLCSALVAVGWGTSSLAATINVPGPHGPTIQAAVDAAVAGDEILVDDGTYTENVLIDKDIELRSVNGSGATTIVGISSAGALGTIQITNSTTAVRIGDVGQGFIIEGIDNGAPGVENAGIYFQGSHSGATVQGNNVVAKNDACLLTEYGATISNFVIDGNEFSGSTFSDPPAGYGFGDQFTLPNVPRQLVTIGCGSGCTTTSNVSFTNNVVSGTAGGINTSSQEQGNTLVTVDAQNAVVTGNSFVGTTTRFATSLRCRGAGTTISGNNFSSAGLTPSVGHVFTVATGESLGDIATNNTFDKVAWVDVPDGTLPWVIQPILSVAPDGTIVNVGPGDYEEQLHITTNVTLQGDGAGSTVIQSPMTLTEFFTTTGPNDNYPVVFVDGAANVTIRDLTVDGLGRGNANYRFQGIGFWNAGGAVLDCNVVGIEDTPFSGSQHGVGIYSYNPSGGPLSLEVGNVNISNFQKTAIALSGPDLDVDVHGCSTVGAGPTGVTAQNGIQIGFGADGTVTDCVVSGIDYTGATWTATGCLFYGAGTVNCNGVDLSDCQTSVYYQDTSGTFENSTISSPTGDAFYAYSTGPTAGAFQNPRREPQPFGESYSGGSPLAATIGIEVRQCVVTGVAATDSWGVTAYGTGPITFSVENCEINNWDWGVVTYDLGGATVDATIFENDLSGNTTYSVFTNLADIQDASANWHGAIDAPTVAGGVDGPVDYSPWLNSGVDQDGGTPGFQGDFSGLSVDADSPTATAPGGIMEALGLVSGSTINVSPGTYSGNLVLNTSVNLLGAQAGVDARGRVVGVPNPAVESVLTAASGRIIELDSGCAGSVIDGFTFSGADKGIESTNGPLDNVEIRNNYFTGHSNVALFMNNNGVDMTVHQNEFDGSTMGSTVAHFDQDNFDGLYFTSNNVLSGPGTGFFVDGNHNIGVSGGRAPLFDGNVFDGNETGANLGRFAFEFGTISNNEFKNSGYDGLQGGIQNSSITDNSFEANGRYGLAFTGFGGGTDPTRGAQDNTVSGNTFTGNVSAGLLFSSGQYAGTISTNVANGNDFVGNVVGASYAGTETIDITCNWWGDINGPDIASNPNPAGDDIVGSSLVFWSWLDGSIGGSPSCNQSGTNLVAVDPTGTCVSTASTCETVPMVFSRTDASPARGISVSFELSPELELCGSIAQGTWLNGYGTTYQVIDHGGGAYTVDQAILGNPCGVTTGGLLFEIPIQKAAAVTSDAIGTITVTQVTVRDCSNGPLAGLPGADASIEINVEAPDAPSALAAAQKKTGNDADGTTQIDVSFTLPTAPDFAYLDVYRKGYGDYPEYNDGTGAVPSVPTSPGDALSNGWTLAATGLGGGPLADDPGARDYWYYVAFAYDDCGNVSAVSNMTDGTLSYHLGDVSDGSTNGNGDNQISLPDMSLLGAQYGISIAMGDTYNYLDVGPTDDFSVDGLPLTDNQIQFEDLILFAINHGVVSLTDPLENAIDLAPKGDEVPTLVLHPAAVMADGTFSARLVLSQADQVQGVHAKVDYDAAAFELVSVEPGRLIDSQNVAVFFDTIESEGSVSVDAAALGTGNTIHGSGHYASLRFRAIGESSPLMLAEVSLRDTQNRERTSPTDEIESASDGVRNQPSSPSFESRELPTTTMLLGASPNPFQGSTSIRFQLAEASPVRVDVFDVSGRLVRSLRNGTLPAGTHAVTWDGRTAQGSSADTGIYLYRVQVGSKSWSSKLVLDR